jgi:endonuclease/exonuclease/phosphatase family metal-dependent hydrolase
MKLITLNIWGGTVLEPLLSFFERRKDIDIFCLQEVYHDAREKICQENCHKDLNLLSSINRILHNHKSYFRPVIEGYGIAIFVKKNIDVLDEGDLWIHENPNYPGRGPTHSRNMQWVKIRSNQKKYTISNVHGLWNGQGKSDSSERLLQSKRISDFLEKVDESKILCGDFNLRPDTKSLEIVEVGMHNLVKAHNIRSTRTSYYTKDEKFADYIFTCPKVAVNRFEVIEEEVSDHAPLLLDFH